MLTHPRGVQKGDKRESEGGGRQRVCFNLAGRFPLKLKGAFLDYRNILVISFVLFVKVRYAISETYLKLSDLNLVPEGAPKGTSGYPVFMIFGVENVIFT